VKIRVHTSYCPVGTSPLIGHWFPVQVLVPVHDLSFLVPAVLYNERPLKLPFLVEPGEGHKYFHMQQLYAIR